MFKKLLTLAIFSIVSIIGLQAQDVKDVYSGTIQISSKSAMYVIVPNGPDITSKCSGDEKCLTIYGQLLESDKMKTVLRMTVFETSKTDERLAEIPPIVGRPIVGSGIAAKFIPESKMVNNSGFAYTTANVVNVTDNNDVWAGKTNNEGAFAFQTNKFGVFILYLDIGAEEIDTVISYN